MRAFALLAVSAMLFAAGCAKKDDTSVVTPPAPTDTAPAPMPAEPSPTPSETPPADASSDVPPEPTTPPPAQ